jgi:SOS response regulatory protein OraA/RecX
MNKSKNRNMGNKRSQENMTAQKINNHTIEDLVDSEGDESSVAEAKRMITRMFKELKEDVQKQLNSKRI